MEKYIYAILTVVLFYGTVCLWMFWHQNSYIYFPHSMEKDLMAHIQAAEGLSPWIGENGIRFGWKNRASNSTHSIVFLHGNGNLILERTDLVAKIRKADPQCDIYLLEYPGYADMPGTPSEKSIVSLASTAVQNLAVAGNKEIYLLGESLGTGVACATAARESAHISGLLLLTPFDSLVSAAAVHYPWLPVSILLHERFESSKNLKSFTKPVAIVVADDDEVVPARLGRLLYKNYSGPKDLMTVAGGHNDAVSLLSVADFRKLLDFLKNPPQTSTAVSLRAP